MRSPMPRPIDTGAGLSDHACWLYSTDAERADVASAWLTEGLALGQQALYIGDGTTEQLVADLATLPDRDAALASGALQVSSARETYDLTAPIDAAAQVAVFDGRLQEARAAGFTGICAVGDVTALLVDDAHRRAFLHWEQVTDRYCAEHPVAPLCMYDARVVSGLDAIVCAHRLHGPEPAPCSVHATTATAVAVTGELDSFAADILREVLVTAPSTDEVLDVTDVGFVDTRAAWVLQDHLRRRQADGRSLRVRGAPEMMRRVWDVCGFDPALLGAGYSA
jgi:anti-anti-sigma factor